MDILKFLNAFTSENFDAESNSRRDSFKTFATIGRKALIASVPFGLATALPKRTFAQSGQGDPIAALQLALTLEYLEAAFYNQAVQAGGIVETQGNADSMNIFTQIASHENSHVAFLQAGLGADSIASPTFDFTAGGLFDPFNESGSVSPETSYAQFLAIAQTFEDTGVRAYKGQAGNLMGVPSLLEAALQIHSVEARHASEVRRLRGLKGWITLDNRGAGMPSQTQAVYDGEQNVTHLGVDNIQFVPSGTPNPAQAVSEAYDEPMSGETAAAIAGLFIV